ncbi:MAG TPA: SpoIIE family protein phosphatase [Bacillota bacterium]|nr:SpoIIE family protein phosphatase [Bacillota bacterium]
MNRLIETSWSSLSKYGEELCGDNIEIARTADAVVAVLADGLGSGVKANILSKMTAKIIATMFEKGATLQEVVETVTDTLPLCQKRNLAYSTFTIIQVRKDGETYIVEFDNPAVFYLEQGKIRKMTAEPVEICGKRIMESRFVMRPGDTIIAVSDGVIHAGIGEILNLGWQWENVAEYLEQIAVNNLDAESWCQWLMNACEQLYAGKPGDDTSVLTVKLRNPRTLTVALGPPRHRTDDAELVRLIMAEPGKRVICGGTTGGIVARHLGQEIEVNLEQLDPVIPPTGRLPGMELVTEGIITVSNALQYLKQYKNVTELPEPTNGALALARLLMESDKIQFLVGKAVNPAHQNPDLPLNATLKMQVIKEICDLMQKRGKDVAVRYF